MILCYNSVLRTKDETVEALGETARILQKVPQQNCSGAISSTNIATALESSHSFSPFSSSCD
jgi:hypothetical protein